MINADADPALIVGHVVDTIGNGLAQLLVLEIMDAHLLGSALGSPFLARILEISQQFLLLRVDRHDRLAAFLYPSDLLADVLELVFTVWLCFALAGLAVGLQTVTRRIEQKGHRAVADRVVLPSKFLGQLPRAFASPAQRRLRMAARHRIHQSIQGVPQTRIGLNQKFAPTTRTTNAWAGQRLHSLLGFQLAHAGQNRCPGNPRGVGYMADAAPAQLHSFRGGPLSPHAFVHNYSKGMELSPSPFDSSCIMHAPDGPQPTKTSNINLTRLFFRGSLPRLGPAGTVIPAFRIKTSFGKIRCPAASHRPIICKSRPPQAATRPSRPWPRRCHRRSSAMPPCPDRNCSTICSRIPSIPSSCRQATPRPAAFRAVALLLQDSAQATPRARAEAAAPLRRVAILPPPRPVHRPPTQAVWDAPVWRRISAAR